jgi:hypothetical protein
MKPNSTIADSARIDARMLDRAEGVLLALRRCSIDEAFSEIIRASKRHHIPTFCIASALVALAENSAGPPDPHATAAARYEWGSLLESGVRG